MKLKILIIFVASLFAQNIFSQKAKSIVKSNSNIVDIIVDGELFEKAWTIDPDEELDILEINAKNVKFITDIDSISIDINFDAEPFNFIILLNGKDSAKTQVKYEPSRLEILKHAEEYNYSDNRYVPKFTYQSEDNPDLKKVRQELKLDSIAGQGSELLKIFNLMYWVHDNILHDGTIGNPNSPKNAIDLINVCKTENRGLNCRMLSTILNECYLAMGIKSRIITCMPKEYPFQECHVINMVFSKELNKWIWIDPTNCAYIMDEKGNLLGIQEVRERLIKDQPLILNADANWNRKVRKNKEEYLDGYMSKNLYRMACPLTSEYNMETWDRQKEIVYLELLPLDGLEQLPQKNEETYQNGEIKYVNYKTNNPDLFWTLPDEKDYGTGI